MTRCYAFDDIHGLCRNFVLEVRTYYSKSCDPNCSYHRTTFCIVGHCIFKRGNRCDLSNVALPLMHDAVHAQNDWGNARQASKQMCHCLNDRQIDRQNEREHIDEEHTHVYAYDVCVCV